MEIGSIFTGIDISASGLKAQRQRLEVAAANIANAETTRTPEGGPYRRQVAILEESPEKIKSAVLSSKESIKPMLTHPNHIPFPEFYDLKDESVRKGVVVKEITRDEQTPLRIVYQPGHPDADENGYVQMPNVNIVDEMVDVMTATRAYEANASALQAAKQMALKALEI